MLAYTRRQLFLLALVVAVGAAGLAVDRWRRGNPDVVAYLESLDRAPAPPPRDAPAPAPRELRARRASQRASDMPQANAPSPRPVTRHDHARGRRGAADDTTPIDVNVASAADFERLPGVGPSLAARIVEVRARDGPFASVDDLRRVRGVGGATLERLRPRLAVNTP
jgi:competence ComEA-like helix-hairpin-helix protein